MRSKLFCRHSDPHALSGGLDSVEACCERLGGVARSLEQVLESQFASGCEPDTPECVTAIREALEAVLAATTEIAECASEIEATANEFAPGLASEQRRWSGPDREHYPELLDLSVPPLAPGRDPGDPEDLPAVLRRCSRQIAAVKDRYTILLPGLAWVGTAREEFTGKRLTRLRGHLETACDSLCAAQGPTEVLVPGVI